MPTLRKIEAILRSNVDRALQMYDEAVVEFDATRGGFLMLPKSDGALRTRRSENALAAARQTLNDTRVSLNNFMSGVVPVDFVAEAANGVLVDSNHIIVEFVRRGIALGQTFVKLSRLQMNIGEREAGVRSLRHAQDASDGARRFFERVYTIRIGERESLKVDIETLEAAIEDLRASLVSKR